MSTRHPTMEVDGKKSYFIAYNYSNGSRFCSRVSKIVHSFQYHLHVIQERLGRRCHTNFGPQVATTYRSC